MSLLHLTFSPCGLLLPECLRSLCLSSKFNILSRIQLNASTHVSFFFPMPFWSKGSYFISDDLSLSYCPPFHFSGPLFRDVSYRYPGSSLSSLAIINSNLIFAFSLCISQNHFINSFLSIIWFFSDVLMMSPDVSSSILFFELSVFLLLWNLLKPYSIISRHFTLEVLFYQTQSY